MLDSLPFDRRAFLLAGGMSYFGLDLAGHAAASPTLERRRAVAKSTIMIWLGGGASHIDTWDLKPDAPEEYRGTFKPVATSAPEGWSRRPSVPSTLPGGTSKRGCLTSRSPR